MKSVTVPGKSANEIIEIVHQMKAYGWTDGVDFDWHFRKAESFDELPHRHTVFNFYKEEYSTYFVLRWL